MQIIFEGHSCFSLISNIGVNVLIDPYISDNPLCKKDLQQFTPDLILITHAHHDHVGDAIAIARATNAVIAAQTDLLNCLDTKGISTIAFNMGGTIHFSGLEITMTQAIHGSACTFPGGNNKYGGLACGYVIKDGQCCVYHAGDTDLFGDMQAVISRHVINCALLPIGDYYTMGPDNAITAAHWLEAEYVIPMHYDTFPAITQDVEEFAQKLEDKTEAKCIILAPGEYCLI